MEKVGKLLPSKTRNWTKEHGASGLVVLNEYGNRVDSDYEYWVVNQSRSWQKIGGFIGRNKTTDWQNDFLSELIKKKQEQADDEHETEALGPVEYDETFEKRYANDDTFTKHRFEERGNTVGNIIYRGIAAKRGQWIYYNNKNSNNYLYKMRTDGTGVTRLNKDKPYYINLIGGWIYYSHVTDANLLDSGIFTE